MIRRVLCLTLLLTFLFPAAFAAREDQIESLKAGLTEVYGYTLEDAEAFEFSDDGHGTLRYWHKDDPQWVYTRIYLGGPEADLTPFFEGNWSDYPGEASIRDALYSAKEHHWFSNWDQAAMKAFRDRIALLGNIRPTVALSHGLTQGNITAAQAVEEFFISCLGPPALWTLSAREWRDKVLKQNGLQLEPAYALPKDTPIQVEASFGEPMTRVEFVQRIPEQIQPLFSHPRLEGWVCLGGVINEIIQPDGKTRGVGVAGFEKEQRRLLVSFAKKPEEAGWEMFPVSENALRTDRDILFSGDNTSIMVRIAYILEDGSREEFTVLPVGTKNRGLLCRLVSYQRINEGTSEVFRAENKAEGWELTGMDAKGTSIETSQHYAVFSFMDAITDIAQFPTTYEAWNRLRGSLLPENTALLLGVNLRQQTSSRSKSLGEMNPGTLAKILGWEKGDPHPWLHAQVGLKTGYVSSIYVKTADAEDFGDIVTSNPLLVAKAKKNISLKSGTGWLDGSVMDLPAGTKMHVISEEGGWFYVVVPQGEIGWLMDVEGTYGYVHPGDVTLAATAIQTDWILE